MLYLDRAGHRDSDKKDSQELAFLKSFFQGPPGKDGRDGRDGRDGQGIIVFYSNLIPHFTFLFVCLFVFFNLYTVRGKWIYYNNNNSSSNNSGSSNNNNNSHKIIIVIIIIQIR